MRVMLLAGAAIGWVTATGAVAAPIQDGIIAAGEYGAGPTATVIYSRTAPTSNFDTPTNTATAGYNIYQSSSNGFYYGAVQATTAPDGIAGLFANLYFDLDPAAGNGSDLGFEISASGIRAFAPGFSGYAAVTGGNTFGMGQTLEYAIPTSYFTAPIPGLYYEPGQAFPGNGDSAVLRLSQSLSYSVAGGPTYGPNRLGAVAISAATAVPEPASLALLGVGVTGVAAVRRRRTRAR